MILNKPTKIFLNLGSIDYSCPYCLTIKDDSEEKLLKRCNKNKSGYTKVKCECGNTYGFTYNIMGNAVAFKL